MIPLNPERRARENRFNVDATVPRYQQMFLSRVPGGNYDRCKVDVASREPVR